MMDEDLANALEAVAGFATSTSSVMTNIADALEAQQANTDALYSVIKSLTTLAGHIRDALVVLDARIDELEARLNERT